jgi:hypothetical protein
MRFATYLRLLIASSIVGLGLTSCSLLPVFSPQSAHEQSDEVTPESQASDSASCATTSGAEALEEAISKVPPPFPNMPLDEENQWSRNIPTDTYDPCAALSWIGLEIDRASLSSPYQVVFFHNGVYVGRAVNTEFGFPPQVTQINGTTIEIGFSWPEDDEPNAMATVRATSTYSLDETTGRIIREGELPPRIEPAP